MKQDLLIRWRNLWQRLGAHTASEPVYEELVRCYAESQRTYHTLIHVQDCLQQFDLTRDLAEHATEVEMAIWCHDVIYDPYASDNEEQSAVWARKILQASAVRLTVIERVAALILTTRHQAVPDWPDAALLVDVDLSIFGRSSETFDRYDAAIRQEYRRVPEQTYRDARLKVLESFLARTAIFQTAWFNERYEAPARQNLSRAIDRMRASQGQRG